MGKARWDSPDLKLHHCFGLVLQSNFSNARYLINNISHYQNTFRPQRQSSWIYDTIKFLPIQFLISAQKLSHDLTVGIKEHVLPPFVNNQLAPTSAHFHLLHHAFTQPREDQLRFDYEVHELDGQSGLSKVRMSRLNQWKNY